ncbi:hypothetical protein D5086_020476 [Populus alba]|uniref:Uncharacterized protein n=1 Tax=Populus alba TaxID=43335 RepID=A0ACC4BKT1_POPAL
MDFTPRNIVNVSGDCFDHVRVFSDGMWNVKHGESILQHSLVRFHVQLIVIFLLVNSFHLVLQRFHFTHFTSEILAGIVLGQTVWRDNDKSERLFPTVVRNQVFASLSKIGYILFSFLIGVRMEPSLIWKTGRTATFLATLLFIFHHIAMLSIEITFDEDKEKLTAGFVLAKEAFSAIYFASITTTEFVMVSTILMQLKIINSQLGHLALASSLLFKLATFAVGTLFGFINAFVNISSQVGTRIVIYSLALIVFTVVVSRKTMLFFIRSTPVGKPMKEIYTTMTVGVLFLLSAIGDEVGLHYMYGPLILGLAVPARSPLAEVLVAKFDTLVSGFFLPLMAVFCSSKLNLFQLIHEFKDAVHLQISLIGYVMKLLVTFIGAYFCKIPLRHAIALTIILNAKGITEIAQFLSFGDITELDAASGIFLVFLLQAFQPLLIKKLYNPADQYIGYQNKSIEKASDDAELQILACAHRQEDAVAAIKLLQYSNPTKQSPLSVYVLCLEELVSSSTPLLINHQLGQKMSSYKVSRSQPIIDIFKFFESQYKKFVRVNMFTAVSPLKQMHEDICWLSFDKACSLIILPFHKKWNSKGKMVSSNTDTRNLNITVLERAPCSVGILIDRSRTQGLSSIFLASTYRVAALFFGGPDDREAVAYALRMAGRFGLQLTVMRFITPTTEQVYHDWDYMLNNYNYFPGIKLIGNLSQASWTTELRFPDISMAGMIFGPSLLGQNKKLLDTMFPVRSTATLWTVASFGNLFYTFLIAVKADPAMMLKPGRAAMYIGSSMFCIPLFLSLALSFLLKTVVTMEANLNKSIVFIAASQSFTGFPVVAAFLTELKIQNTDVGRLALASAVFSDLIDIVVAAISLTLGDVASHPLAPVRAVLSNVAFVIVIVFIIKPMAMWTMGPIKEMKLVGEKCIFVTTVVTLLLAFVSEIVGQHYVLGPLIFGLALPIGPSFGANLVSKLSSLVCGLLFPAYLAVTGLQTNIFKVDFQSAVIVGIVMVSGIIIKLGAVILPALHSQVPVRDAFLLAIILNIKGIVEINVYNFWKDNKTLHDGDYALCVVSVILTNVVIAPLVKLLYNPSRQYHTLKRSTIQHCRRDSEFRMLVCIHNRENVPTIINLLEISHATEESPIAVIGLVLVKIEGRAAPILIANSRKGVPETESSSTTSILNALRNYEQNHRNSSTVQSFTSITHFETMHDDICRLAMNKRATIVIMPFHKKWAIDGSIESTSRSIQQMNRNVLKNAPCSVGILIDRGILNGSLSVLNGRLLFNVAVLFFGGPDDAESLAYGARMVRHGCVRITVVNFLLFGNANSKERKRDSDLINEYRQGNLGNQHFLYFEEVVRDGVDLAGCLAKMVGCFDLILVGKYHQKSPLFKGLEEWSECPELGVIGDMLASPGFECAASVLVVQQPRMRVNETAPLIHDAPDDNRVCLSMERWN